MNENSRKKTYQLYVEGLIEMEFDESEDEEEILYTMIEAVDKSDMNFELRRSDPNNLDYKVVYTMHSV